MAQSGQVIGTLNVILKHSLSQVNSPAAHTEVGFEVIFIEINSCERRGRKQGGADKRLEITTGAPQSLANLVEHSNVRIASQLSCPRLICMDFIQYNLLAWLWDTG